MSAYMPKYGGLKKYSGINKDGLYMLIYLAMCGSDADSSKFELLYQNYKASMFKIANAILKDAYLAEDAVHQSFIKIIKNLHKIDDVFSNKTRALIVIIVRNTSIDIYRRRKRNYAFSLEEMANEPIDDNMTPPEFVISEESFELMKTNISKMPQKYSDVIVLRYFYGYSNAEIAQLLNISNENVRHRLHRAKKMLLEIMKEGEIE